MTLKEMLGLDTRADRYTYGVDPVAGYVSAQKIPERWVSTTCGYCSVGCGMFIGVKDGRAVSVRGNPDHPVNRGMLCPKGLSEHHTINADNRARYPLLRRGGSMQRVTWDDALTTMAARFRDVQARYGDGAVGVISTGQLVTEEFYTMGKLIQLGIGTSNYDGNTTLCMSTAVQGYKRSFGSDGPPGAYEDLERADVIILIGANVAENHPILCWRLRSNPNATIIVIDPRVTKTAMMADLHLALRPRSDLALINGLIHIVIEHNLIDRDYIDRYTTGFEELRASVREYTPERVADITGLSPELIFRTAWTYARADAAFIGWTMGVNHSTKGTETVNAINNLALITGNIGRAGAAPFSITGQCNAMGTREAGFASIMPGYRKFESQADREELARVWNVPVERIPTTRGLAYPDIIEAVLEKRIRALWIIATNPIVSFPNLKALQQALEGLEFLVVQDCYHPTPTTEYAHLMLPAAGWGEKEGTYTNSERRVNKVNRAVSPPGEAKADFDIFLQFAGVLGVRDELFPGWTKPADAFEEWKRVSAGRLCDYSGITYKALEQHGGVQWPFPAGASNAGETRRLYAEGGFRTGDGRARLIPVQWEPFPEQPSHEFPFVLNTGRTVEHWHTRTKTGKVPILERLSPNAWVEMNPRDARGLRLKPQDRVDVISRRGRVRGIELRVTETVAPGQIFVPFHYAEANANEVTQSAFDPFSREPNYKQSAARVERAPSGIRDQGSGIRVKGIGDQGSGIGDQGSGIGDQGPGTRALAPRSPIPNPRSPIPDPRSPIPERSPPMRRLVVVGNGMAGMACVEQILKYEPRFRITVFGDETHVNYNRVMLSSVLAGEKAADEIIINSEAWYRHNGIDLRVGVRIIDVDPRAKTVTGDDGSVTAYDTLLLATGSSAWMPPIEGLDKDGVFAFRTLDDTRELIRRSGPDTRAVVIGGGLLGLEAARGLQVQGCKVTVVHLMATLMERQLDKEGGQHLVTTMERLGIHVLLGRSTKAIRGKKRVERVEFADGEGVDANLVVVAAGIRPNVELGRKAGLTVKRGIVVNDHMETSDPDIFAVGECVEHRGICYGLVAPLYEQGKVLAATMTGHRGAEYTGTVQAAKLKIMGVDVFSAGEWGESGADQIKYEDSGRGVYKKVAVKDGKLAGVILVGDTSDSHRYMDWLRTNADIGDKRGQLLFPPPSADAGLDVAEMSEGATVCGCVGVTKGTIIAAIHERGVNTISQLKESTRACTGCGSCTSLCQELLRAVAPDFEDEKKKVICACMPFAEDRLREILRSQKLKSVQEVLEIYGNGIGCEICKPALSYMLDMLWCGDHDEDRSARFINDRVHANIQKDGTFSVVPRIRGGVTSPDELRRIADVADKYRVPMVKITGSQRIDLLGIKKADLPKVWADLGMPSGQAYTKGVRMVKTCVGTEFCRFGTQDSTGAGIELERRFEQLFTPHKVKMATVGCPRNCAEATVKDIGLIGIEGGWQVVVGGAAGKSVRKADLLTTVETTEQALEASELFFQYYRENANYLERTYDFVERLGIEKIRKDTIYAPDAVRAGLRDRFAKSKARARDAWLEGQAPTDPTQFTSLEVLDKVFT